MQMFDLWGQVGAYVPLEPPADKTAVRALVGSTSAGRDELRSTATLSVDGSKLRAEVSGVAVGWVPVEVASSYLPVLAALTAQGRLPRVTARVNVYDSYQPEDAGDGVWVSSYIALAEPHLLQPLNAPPTAAHVELPEGRKQKVAVTVDPSSVEARPWIQPEGAGWVYCSLHAHEEQLARTTREVVQVEVDSVVVGTLTPAMSKNFLPLVNLVAATDRVPVARGLIKGNHLQLEMTVAALKSSEVTQAWLRDHGLTGDNGAGRLPAPDATEDPIEAATDPAGDDLGPDGSGPDAREPGFYADPQGMADERFWDGFDWTSRIRMRPKPAR
ncbi:DUF2510 domain-containing protein [Nocardioides zeae]|uniref:DUF2510 domain-containing protein n=1 Tax=Nocardioides zeae TaxID=1457234 RepID=A0AAJ1U0V9_9ACTN|nr:DUF2510 domain-containing protein [Nocardioides zeae]MDQ1103755.1 hypothetical protein [Nocardioides zeae]